MSEQDKDQEFSTGDGCSRRDFLKVAGAAGAAVGLGAGLSSLLAGEASAWPPTTTTTQQETTTTTQQETTTTTTAVPPPITMTEYNQLGLDLESHLYMRTYPMAIKLLKSEAEIPEGAFRPKKDKNEHYAMCQVFALARRQGQTIAMFKEDHWCFQPLISYGLIDKPDLTGPGGNTGDPVFDRRLPVGEYPGIVVAPLKTANFTPDLLMMYCDSHQLRHLSMIYKSAGGRHFVGVIDPIGSCVYSVTNPFLDGIGTLVVPDPGDYDRAGAEPHEMIVTIPAQVLQDFKDAFYQYNTRGPKFRQWALNMQPDFPQPKFYQDMFKEWGLDAPKVCV